MVENEKERATGTVSANFSGFPASLWSQWNADCINRFGDVRWIKMWTNHLEAQKSNELLPILEAMQSQIDSLERSIIELKNKENVNSNPKKDFGFGEGVGK